MFKKDSELKDLKEQLITLDRQILQTFKTKDEPVQEVQVVEFVPKSSPSNDSIRSGESISIKEIIEANRDRILIE